MTAVLPRSRWWSILLMMTVAAWLTIAPPVWSQVATATSRMVVVDGRAMRVRTQGLDRREPGKPVIVFEAGAGSGLDAWDSVFTSAAALAPAIAYDRRGLGKSEADGQPQTLKHVARSLNDLLRAAAVPPPYVLVGQSYGGVIIRAYAQTYPTDVVGMVYLDVPDIEVTSQETRDLPAGAREIVFNVPAIPADAPPGLKAEMENIAGNIRTEFAEARAARPPAHIPAAVVIGAGKTWPGATPEIVAALLRLQIKHQQEWALQSPQGLVITSRHLRHMVHINDPALTVRVIQHVLSAATSSQ
jgi:pimeloyl-ACP methyl ester carboxylesterase